MRPLTDAGALEPRAGEGELALGPAAGSAFADLGVRVPTTDPRPMLAYAGMDSLAGQPHLGGQLGADVASAFRNHGWVAQCQHPRRLTLTPSGHRALARHGITLAAPE